MSPSGHDGDQGVHLIDRIVHRHEVDEITWVLEGDCVVEIDGVRHHADTRNALLIPAGVEHEILPRPDSIVFPILIPTGLGVTESRTIVRTAEISACARVLLQPGLSVDGAVAAAGTRLRHLVQTAAEWTLPPLPTDPRARVVADEILDAPGSPRTVEDWARRVHISSKTLQRSFLHDTGLPFTRWRTAVRLTAARRLLLAGSSVAATARHCGYSTASSFTAAFRGHFGTTPGRVRRP